MSRPEGLDLGHPHHRSVVGDEFGDHSDLRHSRKGAQIDGGFGVTRTFEDSSRTRAQRQDVAYVLFDNEEKGLLGASAFIAAHPQIARRALIINMDCIGDGDTILLVTGKKLPAEYVEKLRAAFVETDAFKVRIESAKKVNYTSDQKHFPYSIAAAAMKKKKWLGLYMDRIHTSRDTICAPENIEYVVECARKMV